MPTPSEVVACKRKKRFKNDAAAQYALKKINPTRSGSKPTRVYKCSVCLGWHLTSSAKK